MEKSEIISRMMLAIELVSRTQYVCTVVERECLCEDLGSVTGASINELGRIHRRLRKGLKEYCGKDISELTDTALDVWEFKIERREKIEKEKD